MFVYIHSEKYLWTVGFYGPDNEWHPESDHQTKEEAAKRCNYLNGGGKDVQRKTTTKNDKDKALNWVEASQDTTDFNEALLKAMYALVHAILYTTYE